MTKDKTDGPEGLHGDDGFDNGHLVDDDDLLPFALDSHGTSFGLKPSPDGVFGFSSETVGASLAATSISSSLSSRGSATTLSIPTPERNRSNRGGLILEPKGSPLPLDESSKHTDGGESCVDDTADTVGMHHELSIHVPHAVSSQLDKVTTEDSKSTIQDNPDPSVILPGVEGEVMTIGMPTVNDAKGRVDSPESSTNTASTAHMSDEFQSVIITPLFPSEEEPKPSGSNSLGFSDLMREADDAVAMERSFNILEAVPEEAEETATQSSRQSSAATPMVSNCVAAAAQTKAENSAGFWGHLMGQKGGITIVPAASGDSLDQFSPQKQPGPYEASSRGVRYSAGDKVQASHLDKDTFCVTTRVPPPCSVRDVIDVLASPDLLRLWCVPVKTAIVTREGNALSNEVGLGSSGERNREYDGEWVEVTTTQLVSPSTCGSCLYKGVTAAKNYLGFPSHGSVKMFVERNRGQVGLTIGPFAGGTVTQHTIRVQDAETVQNVTGQQSAIQGGVTVTNTVRISTEDECEGYSCGLLDALGACFLPGLADYIGQAALSLENLRDLVCAGETAALSSGGTCSIDFAFGAGGLQGDNNDGRTPLLAHP